MGAINPGGRMAQRPRSFDVRYSGHMKFLVVAGMLLASGRLPAQQFRLAPVVTGLSVPTDIQSAGDGSGRLFIVQQNGIIRPTEPQRAAAFNRLLWKVYGDSRVGSSVELSPTSGLAEKNQRRR